jgi:hypothetical protein
LALGLLSLIRKYIFKEKVSADAGEQMAARLGELAKAAQEEQTSTLETDEKPRPKAS